MTFLIILSFLLAAFIALAPLSVGFLLLQVERRVAVLDSRKRSVKEKKRTRFLRGVVIALMVVYGFVALLPVYSLWNVVG